MCACEAGKGRSGARQLAGAAPSPELPTSQPGPSRTTWAWELQGAWGWDWGWAQRSSATSQLATWGSRELGALHPETWPKVQEKLALPCGSSAPQGRQEEAHSQSEQGAGVTQWEHMWGIVSKARRERGHEEGDRALKPGAQCPGETAKIRTWRAVGTTPQRAASQKLGAATRSVPLPPQKCCHLQGVWVTP